MPAAGSSMLLGPVLVAENCAASNAPYHLIIRVAGVPQPLIVPFTFTDASEWTQEQTAAEQSRKEALGRVNVLTAAVCQNRGQVQSARSAVEHVLEAAQGQLAHVINMANWAQEKQRYQDEWDLLHQLPATRQVQVARPKLQDWQRAELDRVPGVIGFVYELLYVADDDQARLLSWFAGGRLEDLFVTTSATKNAVKELWTRLGLMRTQSLNIVYLQSSSRPGALPHTGDPLLRQSYPTNHAHIAKPASPPDLTPPAFQAFCHAFCVFPYQTAKLHCCRFTQCLPHILVIKRGLGQGRC